MTKLKEAKKKYKGEWIAFLVKEVTKKGELLGKLIAHDKDRRHLHRILRGKKVKSAYVTFAGPILKPGYAVMFIWK